MCLVVVGLQRNHPWLRQRQRSLETCLDPNAAACHRGACVPVCCLARLDGLDGLDEILRQQPVLSKQFCLRSRSPLLDDYRILRDAKFRNTRCNPGTMNVRNTNQTPGGCREPRADVVRPRS
jgi:hypothetical protein